MLQITAIEPQKKNKDRFNIYVDGRFAFAIGAGDLARERLKIGQTISQGSTDRLIRVNEFSKVFEKVLKFLSYRPRTTKEIKDYLLKKKVDEDLKSVVISKLEKSGLIDDLEFAKWWVANRLKFRPKGLVIIKAELIKKGVEPEIINQVTGQIDASIEAKLALNLARKKFAQYQKLPYQQSYKKLVDYLSRRGFSWSTVKSTIDTIFQKG